MKKQSRGTPLGAWLAELPDDGLVRLLTLRPDLAQPAPASIAALASRAQARQSVQAATDELDLLRLSVLDALLVLHANVSPVPPAALTDLLTGRADPAQVRHALDELKARALAWGDDEIRVASEATAGLPWYPGQVMRDGGDLTNDELAALIGGLDPEQRELLDRLAEGSPVGRTRDARPDAPQANPVPRLLAAGLLMRVDDETVLLPRRVGQLLRGQQPDPIELTPPDAAVAQVSQMEADGAAAVAVIDLLREVDTVLNTLAASPAPELRSGGLGVREAKRLAKATGIGEDRLTLILELAATAGLIASGMPDPAPEDGNPPYWAPTVAADRYQDTPASGRWALLAQAWLALPARPGLVGQRGPDGKPLVALSHALHSSAAPLDRRLLLTMLDELPDGAVTRAEEASAALAWRRPRWAARLAPEPVGHLLAEAQILGILGRGALTTPGRALLRDGVEAAAEAMEQALPDPVDHFLLQADLTVVVPGPLAPELAEELTAAADIESAGAASVYRISEASVRRALDAGHSAGGLHGFFERHSKTPVPQGLTYLIDDVARRHGQLRVGMASSFVRCEDPALLAQAIGAPAVRVLELRLLAPTVAISQAPIGEVLAALRAAGMAPAAEDASGAIVNLAARGARVPANPHRRSFRPPPNPSNHDNLVGLVSVLRRVEATPDGEVIDPNQATVALLRAAMQRSDVLIGYRDNAGVSSRRLVTPVSVRGGILTAFDETSGRVREFAVHRVTSVVSDLGG
ncbi:helicase-associated domain-containing protein [Mycolicibacterium brumae]|uniref:DNA-binding protein n=1 Tax=Mycolicibacterium brumae TaxID=85968 RepID=A0A2G5P602_9MYCO|nr:helicase-associated domain-containing protein [Mycolicibacterium brumae]MCV7191663.1 helicase-associated domain-containing protein [Mycolicibacterium brumae]PIB73540.1 DNA-binding protein [Mycolicibacterium brumae]RWA20482.1 hypothetical protein MBRU_02160 [Mycolicibacterium brumae DSM 44177]UWW07581.1 helicase-associated domain-containing protein [Mycolicibacterium brumae]